MSAINVQPDHRALRLSQELPARTFSDTQPIVNTGTLCQ